MARFERVIPILVYEDIPTAHDFLVRVFGFGAGGVIRDGQGQPVHSEVRIGGTTIWLHRVTSEHELTSARASAMASSGIVVHVDDVDAHYARVRAAGGQIDYEPIDQPYGQRDYGVRDCEGHRWWFATQATVQEAV